MKEPLVLNYISAEYIIEKMFGTSGVGGGRDKLSFTFLPYY